MSVHIYILKLESNKYYIGKTERDIEKRFYEHINGCGSSWTSKYKPLEVIEVFEEKSQFDEDNYTKLYMRRYGISNVRGGSYTSIELPNYQLKSLNDEFNTAENRCFNCNQLGHFIGDCSKIQPDNNLVIVENPKNKKEESWWGWGMTVIKSIFTENICARCGRNTHQRDNCYARTHIKGYKLR
jgi:hypothetical protein